jgi:hypothetical protein
MRERRALTAALLVAVAVFLWLLWQGPWVLDHAHLTKEMTPGVAAVVSGFRTAVLAIGAGLVAGAGLVFTHRTLEHTRAKDREQAELTRGTVELTSRTLEHTQSRDREQAELMREGQVTDRFTRAIGQLASDGPVEQLGGVYALERIMRDSAKDHPTVVEVLAAFIRHHAPVQSKSDPVASPAEPAQRLTEPARRLTEPVQAALTVLGRRPQDRHEPFWVDLHRTDLRSADLQDAQLPGVQLWEANLAGANLFGATLTGANLFRTDLTGANLRQALLRRTMLDQAYLQETILRDAEELTAEQVVAAYPFHSTQLPDDLAADPQVRARVAEVEEGISAINRSGAPDGADGCSEGEASVGREQGKG